VEIPTFRQELIFPHFLTLLATRNEHKFSWDSMQCELWLLSFSFSSKRKKALSIQKSYLELERSSIRDFGKL
jgi:hypothetical protein